MERNLGIVLNAVMDLLVGGGVSVRPVNISNAPTARRRKNNRHAFYVYIFSHNLTLVDSYSPRWPANLMH